MKKLFENCEIIIDLIFLIIIMYIFYLSTSLYFFNLDKIKWSVVSSIGTMLAVVVSLGIAVYSNYKIDKRDENNRKIKLLESEIDEKENLVKTIIVVKEQFLVLYDRLLKTKPAFDEAERTGVLNMKYCRTNHNLFAFYEGVSSNLIHLKNTSLLSSVLRLDLLAKSFIDGMVSYSDFSISDFDWCETEEKKSEEILKYHKLSTGYIFDIYREILERENDFFLKLHLEIESLDKEIDNLKEKLGSL